MDKRAHQQRPRSDKLLWLVSTNTVTVLCLSVFILTAIITWTQVDHNRTAAGIPFSNIPSVNTLACCTQDFIEYGQKRLLVQWEHGVVLGGVLCTIVSIAVAAFSRGWQVKGGFTFPALTIMAETVVFYALLHGGVTAVQCAATLGQGVPRPEVPLRYVWWAVTILQGESALYTLVGETPLLYRFLALLATACSSGCLYAAAVLSLAQQEQGGSIALMVLAMLLDMPLLIIRVHMLRCISRWPFQRSAVRRSLQFAIPTHTLLIFGMRPLIWFCTFFGKLSVEQSLLAYCAAEVVGKSVMANLLSWSDLPQHMDTLNLQLLEAEAHRVGSQAKEAAMRSIVRYLFHELRVPLNSIVLGLTESQEALDDLLEIVQGPEQHMATSSNRTLAGGMEDRAATPAEQETEMRTARIGMRVDSLPTPTVPLSLPAAPSNGVAVSLGDNTPDTSSRGEGRVSASDDPGPGSSASSSSAAWGPVPVVVVRPLPLGQTGVVGISRNVSASSILTGLSATSPAPVTTPVSLLSPSRQSVMSSGARGRRPSGEDAAPKLLPGVLHAVGGTGLDVARTWTLGGTSNTALPSTTPMSPSAKAIAQMGGAQSPWATRPPPPIKASPVLASQGVGADTSTTTSTGVSASALVNTPAVGNIGAGDRQGSAPTLLLLEGTPGMPTPGMAVDGSPEEMATGIAGTPTGGKEEQAEGGPEGVSSAWMREEMMLSIKDTAYILRMCHTSALGLGRLLDDFLSLDKIEQGQLQVELGTVQVKRMVDETLRLFQPAVESKQLRIKRVAHRRVPATIVGDDHKLRQCLANFVSNAIKFSPQQGQVTVHVAVVYAPPRRDFDGGSRDSVLTAGSSLSLKQAGERSRAGSSQLGGSRISVGSAGGGGSLLTLSRAAGGKGVPDREEPGAAPASHLSLPVHVQEQSALGPSKAPPSRGSYTAKRPPAVLTTPFPSVSGPAPVPAAVALDMDAAPVHTDSGDDTSSEDVAELPQLGGQDSSTGKSRDGLLTGLLARAASAWAASMRYVSTAVAPASTPGGVPGRGGAAPGFDLHGGSSISPVGSDAGSRLLGGATPPLAAGFGGAGRVRDAPARVYAEQQEGTVAYLKVSVEDQGVGISPADQAKLFQPFQQIRAGALQKGNGTGLGLSIVRQIINLSGGFVSVESAEGKGSTFSFCVPVAQPKPSLPIETGGPDVLSAGTSAPFSGRRMSSSRESNQKGGFSVTAAEIAPGPVPVRSVVPVGNATAPTARGGSTPHTATAVHVHDSSVVVPPVGPAHPYNLHPAHAGARVVPHPPQPLSGLQEEDGHEASTGTEATEESGSWLYTAAPTSRSTSRTLARTLVSHRSATGRVSTSEVDISSPVPAAAQGGSASKLIHEVTGLVETSGTSAVSTARSPALGPVVVVPGVFRGVHIHVGQAPPVPHLHIHAVHAGVGSLQTIMSVGELPTTASQEGESRSTGAERTENGAAAAAGGAGAGGGEGAVPQEAEAGVQDSLHIGQEGRAPNLRKQSVTVVSLHDVLDAARGEAGVMDILGSARTPVQVSTCATPTPSLTTDQPSPLPSVPVAATEGSTGAGMGRLTGPPTPSTALGIKAVQVGRLTGWYSEPEQEARHHPQHGHPSGTISTAGTSVSGSAGQSTGPGSRERRRGSKERPLALDVPVARSPLARHSTGPATATPSAATRASSRGWAAGAGYSGAHSTMSVPGSVEEGTPAAGLVKLTRAVVVDDIASNRQLLVRMLKRRGVLECYEAADGTEVLAIADQLAAQGKLHTIQAWFLDEEMPVMNGSKAIAALRGAQYSVKAVILSVTGNALAEDQTALVTAGANAVLPKPIQVDALEGLLLRHGGLRLGQRRGSVT